MKHFKTLALLLSTVVFLISCIQRDKFNSLSAEENERLLASANSEHEQEIKNLVNEREIVKIGGGKKDRNIVHVAETVGQNQLKDESTRSSVTNEESHLVTIEVGVKNPVVEETDSKINKKLSLLLYVDNKKSVCVRKFRQFSEDFLERLNFVNDWELALSFHRDNQGLIKMQGVDGDILSKSGGNNHVRSLYRALTPYYGDDYNYRLSVFEVKELNQGPGYLSPLEGLDENLTLFNDNTDGKKVVLYFGDDFPYYTAKEWKDFYSNHKNLTIIAIANRASNFSNLSSANEAGVDVDYVRGCSLRNNQVMVDVLAKIYSKLQ